MLADLHCHSPMHRVDLEEAHAHVGDWWGRLGDAADAPALNLAPDHMRATRDRGGPVGVITARHLLGATSSVGDLIAALRRHIGGVADALGSHDLDGFITPIIHGLDSAADLSDLRTWIRDLHPVDAEAIFHLNAERVVRTVLRRRGV